MDNLVQIMVSLILVSFIGILLNAPKKSLIYVGVTGACGWLVYTMMTAQYNIILSTFVASAVIALLSHIFSRVLKTPTTIFLIPALFPFVPGTSIYRGVYALINGHSMNFNHYLIETLLISGAIATAVFMLDSLFQLYNVMKHQGNNHVR